MTRIFAAILMILVAAPAAISQEVPFGQNLSALVAEPWFPAADDIDDTGRARIEAERQVFAREMRLVHSWPHEVAGEHVPDLTPEQVQQVIGPLQSQTGNEPQTNRDLFIAVLKQRLPLVADALKRFEEQKYAEAAETYQLLLQENIELVKQPYQHNTLPPYTYGLVRLLQADARAMAGQIEEALISYQVVADHLPRNVLIGGAGQRRLVDGYVATARQHAAIPRLRAMVVHFADDLSDQTAVRFELEQMRLAQRDPYRQGAAISRNIAGRLERGETGAMAQRNQDQMIGLLQEMMALAVTEPRPFLEYTDTVAGPGETGKLKTGANPERFLLPDDVDMTGGDDWGQLRPRERQEMLQLFNEAYPPRYRDMLEMYYRRLSEMEAEGEAGSAGAP